MAPKQPALTPIFCLFQKERRILQNCRLDLDACKARLKKAKAAEAKAAVTFSFILLCPSNPRVWLT